MTSSSPTYMTILRWAGHRFLQTYVVVATRRSWQRVTYEALDNYYQSRISR